LNETRGGFRQALSNSGHSRSRDRVHEPAARFAYEIDALVGARRCDEKDQVDPGRLHRSSELIGFFGHEVSRQHSVNTRASKLVANPVKPE
jgi:hypothetical protein